MIDQDSVEYLRQRESAERAAAANASNEKARRLHLELADAYAARVREAQGAAQKIVRRAG